MSDTIKTALGTYVHSKMTPEASTLLALKKTRNSNKPRRKSIRKGAKVIYCGHEATVIEKHPTNKGWWTVEINGKTTSGHRDLITVL